jgi:hypothetical protein
MFKSKRKHKDQKEKELADQMVSFENDAFFMVQEQAGSLSFVPKNIDEEPAYFDELSPEQQAAYDQRMGLAGANPSAADQPAAVRGAAEGKTDPERDTASGPGSDGSADADASGPAVSNEGHAASTPSVATDPRGDEEEVEEEEGEGDVLGELKPKHTFNSKAALAWKRSQSGGHLVPAAQAAESEESTTEGVPYSTHADSAGVVHIGGGHEEESNTGIAMACAWPTVSLPSFTLGDAALDEPAGAQRGNRLFKGIRSITDRFRGHSKGKTDLLPPPAPIVQVPLAVYRASSPNLSVPELGRNASVKVAGIKRRKWGEGDRVWDPCRSYKAGAHERLCLPSAPPPAPLRTAGPPACSCCSHLLPAMPRSHTENIRNI